MNEQQLAAVKLALVALENFADVIKYDNEQDDIGCRACCYVLSYDQHSENCKATKAITAIKQALAQDALDKMAENARELGLNYDTPLSAFVRSSDEDKAEVMERVIDKAIEAQKEKIGCVNHDCDKCKAVQEGRDWSLLAATQESLREHMAEIKRLKAAQPAPAQEPEHCDPSATVYKLAEMVMSDCGHSSNNQRLLDRITERIQRHIDAPTPPAAQPAPVQEPVAWPCVISEADFEQNTITLEMKCSDYKVGAGQHWLHTTPPAAQPVPVKTYHDGKPWPVAPKPWVGLSEEEVEAYDSWADFQVGCGRQTLFDMVRDIDAKLKGKNHG
jgi:hypothetical protein